MEIINFSYQEFIYAVNKLKEQILKNKKIKNIYGIPRGGLVLAVYLSHKTNLPLTDQITKNTLIVDDISDSGKTLKSFINNFIATIHYCNNSLVKPSYYVFLKKENTWIVYPWENNHES
jgi:hypoxanthine phosphoribosyltransferase